MKLLYLICFSLLSVLSASEEDTAATDWNVRLSNFSTCLFTPEVFSNYMRMTGITENTGEMKVVCHFLYINDKWFLAQILIPEVRCWNTCEMESALWCSPPIQSLLPLGGLCSRTSPIWPPPDGEWRYEEMLCYSLNMSAMIAKK